VLDACRAWQLEMERNPVEFLARRSADLMMESRRRLGDYLGARPEDLVYVSNATTGVNTVARSLDLAPGDEVLATDHEYGACDGAWARACAAAGATYIRRRVPLPFGGRRAVADGFLEGVTERTRMIFVSHIASPTALILPVEELCRRAREAGIPVMIDGAHAPGQIPLDLEALGADFYTGNCHKWMCAPKGAGFLHVRPDRQRALHGLVVSWGYSDDVAAHASYTGVGSLDRRIQWQGTRDLSAFLSVPAAIDFMDAAGWSGVRARCHALAVETMHRACGITGEAPIGADSDFAQMVPIPLPESAHPRLGPMLLERHRIEIPVTEHGGRRFLRASFNGYNTAADAEVLLEALRELLGGA